MGGGRGGQKVSKGLTSTWKTKWCLPAPEREVFWWKRKVARNQRKNAKKIKSASCSFQNPSVSLSKMNSVYPTDETALSIRKTQRSNFTYDFRCFCFFSFTKYEAKICLLLLIRPKTTSQVWGKGTFRNNGKAPPSSLYWGHEAARCFALDGDVRTRCVPPGCAQRLSDCTRGRQSTAFTGI